MLTLTEAKLHLRVDHDDEDPLISGLIATATAACADYLNMLPSELVVAVPAPIKSAALLLIGTLYEQRESVGERLQKDQGLDGAPGVISSAMHRDDFAQRGLSSSAQTSLPFDVNGADILVLDDVLYTGRTVRAVLNELYDYGRPARVRLAVLVDRGGRELPVQADFAAARVVLPAGQSLALARTEAATGTDAATLYFEIREV